MKTPGVGLLLVSLALTSLPTLGAPGGELDATFGQNGRLIMRQHRSGRAVLQQPADGKLLIAGSTAGDADRIVFAVLRLNTDGSLDAGFGDQGAVAIAFGAGDSVATALALQPDGKVIAAGLLDSNDMAVARLNTDGTLDATFDGDGRATVSGAGSPLDVALEPNGEIRLVGMLDNAVALVRLTPGGLPGLAFASEPVPGSRLVQFGGQSEYSYGYGVVGIAKQTDGAYVVCGSDYYTSWDGNMRAIRLLADGSLDSSFGSNGIWLYEADPNVDSWAHTCVVAADGSILVSGSIEYYPVLVIVRPDGVTDTAVWQSGTISLLNGDAHSLVALADGGLAVGGTAGATDGSLYIARIDLSNGLLDAAFGDQGIATVAINQGDQRSRLLSQHLIEQTDGKIVSLVSVEYFDMVLSNGSFLFSNGHPALAVARIDPNGSGNNGFAGFARAVNYVTEGSGSEAVIAVLRSGGSVGPFLVDYETRTQSATASDYVGGAGTLVWSDGDMAPKLINVRIASDAIIEQAETFQVALSNSTGALAQSIATVVINDDPDPQAPPVYAKGGGGSFGIDLLLLLLCALGPRKFGRSRPARLVALLALTTVGASVQAQTDVRERGWDLGMTFVKGGDARVAGPAGTSIRFRGNLGSGLWATRSLTRRLAIGLEWSRLSPDVETNYVVDQGSSGLGPITTIRHRADIESLHVMGVFNFLDRAVTPFAEIGIGWTALDSNVDVARASGLDPLYYDWYDPWWGRVWHPGVIPGNYKNTTTTVTYALGVRWDVSSRLTTRADLAGIEGHEVSAVSGTAKPSSPRLGFGWRF